MILRSFEHVKRSANLLVRRCERLIVIDLKGDSDRSIKLLREIIRQKMTQLSKEMILNREYEV